MKINKPYEEMSTLEVLKIFLISKLPSGKEKIVRELSNVNEPPQNISISHIAVVLDNKVEEVLRCQNRLAALLLSNPEFVEFDPELEYPLIGLTEYADGKLVTPKPENDILSESKIESLLSDLENKKE
jgi:hypothetical protein